jgi:predicted RNase H-like nuclease (RuvC/YqgF family)
MELMEILTLIGGIAISIIGYFLKQTMNEIKEIKTVAYATKEKVSVIEVDYLNKVSNLNEKIDGLQETIKELTTELKEYNNMFRNNK